MTVRVRQPARFDRSSPVLRYWLSRCEGFDVSGGARGVVTEVVSDGDPIDPDAIVVRTRIRKRTLDARSIAAVIPAERRLVVETARRTSARRARGAGEARRYAAAAGRGSALLGRQSAVAGRRLAAGTAVAAAGLGALATDAARRGAPVGARLLRRLGIELLRLSSLLALAASAGMRLVRSARWRRFGRSARSATTRRSQVLSRSSSRRRTTSSRRSSARRTSRAARTTSST